MEATVLNKTTVADFITRLIDNSISLYPFDIHEEIKRAFDLDDVVNEIEVDYDYDIVVVTPLAFIIHHRV